MPINHELLESNAIDVAAALTENFLNNFSKAHHTQGNEMYHGSQAIDQFNPKVEISYDVENPILFDLNPIPENKFKSIWVKHLNLKGAKSLQETQFTPENIKLTTEKVKFTFSVFKDGNEDIDYEIDFNWDLEARCAILLRQSDSENTSLRIEPIKIAFSKNIKSIKQEIKAKLLEKKIPPLCSDEQSPTEGIKGPNDPIWCMNLERLILFAVNQVLAIQISNFIRSWTLPHAIELVKGVSLSPTYLAIIDNQIVTGAKINETTSLFSPLNHRIESFLHEFEQISNDEFSCMSDDDFMQWDVRSSPTFNWLKEKETEIEDLIYTRQENSKAAYMANYSENIQLLSNKDLFDSLARAYLKAHESKRDEKKLDFIVKGGYEWWLHLSNGRADIIQNGIHIDAQLAVGAKVWLCAPNPDPKHWGEWSCINLGAELTPKPNFGINSFPSFEDSGIYMQLQLTTSSIGVTIPGFPSWANKIHSWIFEQISKPLVVVLKLFISAFHLKLVDYPEYFPGTPIKVAKNNWRFNRQLDNAGSYIVFSGDPKLG